ncbi:MAG: hypothetical protein V8T31_02595 [Lachnospiraceae bacterium]
MRENQKKFAVDNLEIVEGLAPELWRVCRHRLMYLWEDRQAT